MLTGYLISAENMESAEVPVGELQRFLILCSQFRPIQDLNIELVFEKGR